MANVNVPIPANPIPNKPQQVVTGEVVRCPLEVGGLYSLVIKGMQFGQVVVSGLATDPGFKPGQTVKVTFSA